MYGCRVGKNGARHFWVTEGTHVRRLSWYDVPATHECRTQIPLCPKWYETAELRKASNFPCRSKLTVFNNARERKEYIKMHKQRIGRTSTEARAHAQRTSADRQNQIDLVNELWNEHIDAPRSKPPAKTRTPKPRTKPRKIGFKIKSTRIRITPRPKQGG